MKDVANDIVNGANIYSSRPNRLDPDSSKKYVLKPGEHFENYYSPFNASKFDLDELGKDFDSIIDNITSYEA
jgi:hypothetical protein